MIITLTDGRQVDSNNVFFDVEHYAFLLGNSGENITTKIRIADKRTFDGFDVYKYNEILSAQATFKRTGQWPGAVGSESVWTNFANQLLTDPLDAPLDALSNTVDKIASNSGVKTLVTLLIVGVVIAFVIQAND